MHSPLNFTLDEFQERIKKTRQKMIERRLDM
jgi:hypothetical protein